MDKDREKTKQEIIREFGSSPDDNLYTNTSCYLLQDRDGPPRHTSIGSTVQLRLETALPLFCAGKILPLSPEIPALGNYRAVKNFVIVQDGKWVRIEGGDLLKLTFDEALPLLKELKVKLIDEGVSLLEKGGNSYGETERT